MTRVNYRVFRTYMRVCRVLHRNPTVTGLREFAANPAGWLRTEEHHD